jgi:hypothetical protein
VLEAGLQRGAFALVAFVEQDPQIRLIAPALQQLAGAIGAGVVDQDDFAGDSAATDARHDVAHRIQFIVDGNHHRQPKPGRQRVDPQPTAGCFPQQILHLPDALDFAQLM